MTDVNQPNIHDLCTRLCVDGSTNNINADETHFSVCQSDSFCFTIAISASYDLWWLPDLDVTNAFQNTFIKQKDRTYMYAFLFYKEWHQSCYPHIKLLEKTCLVMQAMNAFQESEKACKLWVISIEFFAFYRSIEEDTNANTKEQEILESENVNGSEVPSPRPEIEERLGLDPKTPPSGRWNRIRGRIYRIVPLMAGIIEMGWVLYFMISRETIHRTYLFAFRFHTLD